VLYTVRRGDQTKSFDLEGVVAPCNIAILSNIGTLLRENSDKTDNKYNISGIYQLTCTDCNKKYIGQTGRPFLVRYKEHARQYTHDSNKSNFAKHLLDHQHTYITPDGSMTILHTVKKGPMMNTLEKFHVYKETRKNNQLNDRSTVTPNAIFDTILRNSRDKTRIIKTPTFTRPSVAPWTYTRTERTSKP
jgi:hypothetical protein